MADANGMKYEFGGVRFKDRDALNAALANHLGVAELPRQAVHGGSIRLIGADGEWEDAFTYEHVGGVDVVTSV